MLGYCRASPTFPKPHGNGVFSSSFRRGTFSFVLIHCLALPSFVCDSRQRHNGDCLALVSAACGGRRRKSSIPPPRRVRASPSSTQELEGSSVINDPGLSFQPRPRHHLVLHQVLRTVFLISRTTPTIGLRPRRRAEKSTRALHHPLPRRVQAAPRKRPYYPSTTPVRIAADQGGKHLRVSTPCHNYCCRRSAGQLSLGGFDPHPRASIDA